MNWGDVTRLLGNLSASMFNVEQAEALFNLAQGLDDGATILEIGPYKGYSTCALAAACYGTGKTVWTIDTFRGKPHNTDEQNGDFYFSEFMENMRARGLLAYVRPLIGYSSDFYNLSLPLQMLFIDGNHAMPVVSADLSAFYPSLVIGGILAMHDVYPPGREKPNAPNTWTPLLDTLDGLTYLYNMAWGRKRE